ncbi:hypothetical protein AKJ16_DCAP24878 [Drosera capensis]
MHKKKMKIMIMTLMMLKAMGKKMSSSEKWSHCPLISFRESSFLFLFLFLNIHHLFNFILPFVGFSLGDVLR